MPSRLERYARVDYFDEFPDGRGTKPSSRIRWPGITWSDFQHRVRVANDVLEQRGVTFTVYADSRGTERILRFASR